MSDLASYHWSPWFDFHLLSRRQRIEHDRRTHRIRQRNFVQRLDPLFLLLQAVEHQLALAWIEVNTRDFFGAGDSVDGDLRAGSELRPQHARKERRAEADAGEVSHKSATIQFHALSYLQS